MDFWLQDLLFLVSCFISCQATYQGHSSSLWDVEMVLKRVDIKLFNIRKDSSGQQHADATIGGLNISLQFSWPLHTNGFIQLSTNQTLPVPDVDKFAERLLHQVGFNSSLPPIHLVGVGNFGLSIEKFLISLSEGNVSAIEIVLSIPGWDALNKFKFKILKPKLNIKLEFASKSLSARAIGIITALNRGSLHGLPVEIAFSKTPNAHTEIRVGDEDATVDFGHLVPLLAGVMSEQTLSAVGSISPNVKVSSLVFRLAPGLVNMTVVNVKTESTHPFLVLRRINITNATLEFSQGHYIFYASIRVCDQYFKVEMSKVSGMQFDFEAEQDRRKSTSVTSLLSCLEERKDHRPDLPFMGINSSSAGLRLDLLKFVLRRKPRLEIDEMSILAQLPNSWNVFSRASLPTKLSNVSLSLKFNNSIVLLSPHVKASFLGEIDVGQPSIVAFPFHIRIPTKAKPISVSLQRGKRIQVNLTSIQKLGGLSEAFPAFIGSFLTDIQVTKMNLEFSSNFVGPYQVTDLQLELPSKTKWNFPHFYLSDMKLLYTLNYTLLSGHIALANLSLPCKFEWPPPSKEAVIELSRSVQMFGISSFIKEIFQTFYGRGTLEKSLNGLTKMKLSAISGISLQRASFHLANDFSLTKVIFRAALPKHSWELLDDFFTVEDSSFWVQIEVGKGYVMFVQGTIVLVGDIRIPFTMKVPRKRNQNMTISLPENSKSRVPLKQFIGILTGAAGSRFPAALGSFIPEITLEKLTISFLENLTKFEIDELKAVCSTPWDLGGAGIIFIDNATVIMSPQIFKLKGSLLLGNTNLELELKNTSTGQLFSLVKPVNISELQRLLQDAFKKIIPGLKNVPDAGLLGLDITEDSLVRLAEVQFSNNFDSLNSFSIDIRISKAWSFFRSCCSLIAPTMILRVKDLRDVPTYMLHISTGFELGNNMKRLVIPLECNIPASKRSLITLKLTRAVIFELSEITILPLVGNAIPKGLLSPISEVIGNISLWPFEARFEPVTGHLVMFNLTATALERWNLIGFPLVLQNITLHVEMENIFRAALRGLFFMKKYPIPFQLTFGSTPSNVTELKMDFDGSPEITIKEVGQQLIGGFVLGNLFPAVFDKVKIAVRYLNLGLLPPLRKLNIQSFRLYFSLNDQATLINNWLRIERVEVQLGVQKVPKLIVDGRLACLVTLGVGANAIQAQGVILMPQYSNQLWKLTLQPKGTNPLSAGSIVSLVGGGFDLKSLLPDQILSNANEFVLKNFEAAFIPNAQFQLSNLTCTVEANLTDVWLPLRIRIKHIKIQLFVSHPFDAAKQEVKATIFVEIQLGRAIIPTALSLDNNYILLEIEGLKNQPLTLYDIADLIGGDELLKIVPGAFLNFNRVTLNRLGITFSKQNFQILNASIRCNLHGFDAGFSFPLPLPDPTNIFKVRLAVQHLDLDLRQNKEWELTAGIKASLKGVPLEKHLSDLEGVLSVKSSSATFSLKKKLLDITIEKELAGMNCKLNIKFFNPKIVFFSPQKPQIQLTIVVNGFDVLNKHLPFKVFKDSITMEISVAEKTGLAIRLKTIPILDQIIPCSKNKDWYTCDFTWLCQKDSYVRLRLPIFAYTKDGFSADINVQDLEKLCIPLTLPFLRQFFQKIPFLFDFFNHNLPLWPPPDVIGFLQKIGSNVDNLPRGIERFKSPEFPKEIRATLFITESGPLTFAIEVQNGESVDVVTPLSFSGNLVGISLNKFSIGSVFGIPFVDMNVEVYLWDLKFLFLLSHLPKDNPLLINAEEMETRIFCRDCFFIIAGAYPIPIFAAPLSIKYATLIGAKAQATIHHRRPDYRDFGTLSSLFIGLLRFYTDVDYLLSKEDLRTANSTLLVLKFSHGNELTMIKLPTFTGGSRLTLRVPPIDGKMFLIGWLNFYKTFEPKWLLQTVPLRYRVTDAALNIGPFRWSLFKFAASSANELKKNKDKWPYPVYASGDDALLIASADLPPLSADVELRTKNFGDAGLSLRVAAGMTNLVKLDLDAEAHVNLGDSANPVKFSSKAVVKLNSLLLLTGEAKVSKDSITITGELRFSLLGVIRFGGKVSARFRPGLSFVIDANADIYLFGVRLSKSHLYVMSSFSTSVVRVKAVFMGADMIMDLIRKGMSFNVHAAAKLRVFLDVDLGEISVAGLDIGRIVISTGFIGELKISFPGRSSAKVSFHFMGTRMELPLLTFDSRDARPEKIPQLLERFIREKAPSVITKLFIKTPFELLRAFSEGILDFAGNIGGLFGDLLKAGLKFPARELGKYLGRLVDAGKAIVEAARKLGKVTAQAARVMREAASKAVEVAGKAVQQVGMVAEQAGRQLAETGKALTEAIEKVIRIDNAVKEARRVLRSISKKLNDVVNKISAIARKIADEIARGIRDLAGKTVKVIRGLFGKRAIYRRDVLTDEKRKKEGEKRKLQRNQSDQRTRVRSKERELESSRREEQRKRGLRDEAQRVAKLSYENLQTALEKEANEKKSYDEIINKGKCATGENNCHPSATCLRSGYDGQSFRCECRRGWIGNGTHCERPIKAVAVISDSPKAIGEEVLFSAFTVSGTNVQYKYSFNTTFSQYGVSSHVFSSPGVYVVNVRAQNDVSNSSASTIVVVQAPVTDITLKISGDHRPCRAVNFIPAASGTNVFFHADFGDESSMRNFTGSVSHYFPRSGEFVINVTATNLVSSITKRFLVNISSSPCDQLFCDIWKIETMFPYESPEKIASLLWLFLHSLKAGPREKRYNRIWKFLSIFHPIPYKTLKTLTTGNFSRTLTRHYRLNGSFIELDFIMAGFLSSKAAHLFGIESSFLHPHIRDPIELFTWISSVLLSTEEFLNTWNFTQTRQEYCQNRLSMSTINSALDGYIFGAQVADFPKNGKLSNFLFDYYCPSSSDATFSWKTRYRRFLNHSKTPDNNKNWNTVLLLSKLSEATSNLKDFVSPIKEFCLSTFLDLVWLGANATDLESERSEKNICESYITCQQCIFSGVSSNCFWCDSSNECLSKKSKNQCSRNHTFLKLPCPKTCQLSQRCSDCTVRKGCGWCQSVLSDEGPACHEGGPQGPRSPALCNSVEWYQGTCISNCPVSHGHLCNGKGICRAGKCYCIPGVYGDDCSKEGCVYTARENDTFQFISRRFKLNGTDIRMANRADIGNSTLAFNFHVTIPNIGTPLDCQNRATSSSFHPLFPRVLRIGMNRAGLHSFCGLFGSLASEQRRNPTCDMIKSREQCLRTKRCAWNVKEPCTGMLLKGCFEVTKSLDVLTHQSPVISSPISGNVNITDDSLQITGWPKSEWEGFSVTISHLKPYNITSVYGGQIIGTVLSSNDSLLPDFVRVEVVHDGALKDPLPYLPPCSPGCSQVIHFYNGICDQDCNTTECSYDNGECTTTHFNLSGFSLHPRGIYDIFADNSVRLLQQLQKITGEKDIYIARGPLSVFSLAREVVLEILKCDDLRSLLIFQSYRHPVMKFVENFISRNASLEKITLLTAKKLIELGIYQVSPYGRNGGDYDIAEVTTSSLRNQTRFKVGLEMLSEAKLLDFTLVVNDSSKEETYFHIKIYRRKSLLHKLNDYDPSLHSRTECSSLSWCSGHGICLVNGSCLCDFNYTGKKCQINNCPSQCSGHGTCIDGACVCHSGWEGYDCSKVKLCNPLCPELWIGDGVCDAGCNTLMCLHDKGDCQDICVCPDTWLGDGLCDRTCNSTSCDYDGGDCAKKECSPGCGSEILGDGICDHQCNTEQCSLDDGDCPFAATCSCSHDILGDGVCNDECNKASCMYDYGDCISQVPGDDCPQSCSPPMIGNGFCDVFCNVSSCNMDGGDCDPAATAMRLCYEGCPPRFLGDGVCDSACNVPACNFDNGDCPTPIVQECAAECQVDMVGDGICQAECQVEECFFDASDCQCSQGCSNTSIGDGVCDIACFVESCDYDKMDCMCSSSICPKEYLGNGQCDEECNNRVCDFDGGDCTCSEGCAVTSISDGSCDPACDTKACNFDGLDCGGCESESHLDICDENAYCMTSNDSLPYVKCRCRSSFYGDGFACVKRGNCFNNSKICSKNGQCFESNGTFECYCNEGWVGNGIFCENVDECRNNYDKCGVNAICLDIPGSYKCVCEEGWTGDGYNCTDVNECESNRHLCCENENCFNTEGNYTCSCKRGWRKNDTYRSAVHRQCYLDMNPACVDIDECLEDRHNCSTYENEANAICTNAIGGFKCSCEEGWEGDGYFCFDVNECLNESVCPTNQKCHNLPGNHSCHCKDGFTLETSTKECQDIDECALGVADCDPFAFCTNSYGSFKCECMEGFEDKKRICTEYQCGNQTNNDTHSIGINVTYTTQGVCTCIGEFLNTGKSCMDIDECLLNKFDCPASAPLCQNLIGGYECKCDAVDNSSCDPVNPCNSTCDQNMTCIAVGVEHYCVCPDGFTHDENGTTCVDIDECLNPKFYGSCEVNADCVNRMGSFECRCRSGYFQSGDACFEINECEGTITKTIAGGLEECKAGICASTETCIFRNNSRESIHDSNTTLVCACDHSDSQQIECIEATVQVIQSGENISSLISIPWYATGASSSNISISNQTFHNCSEEMICKNTAGSYKCTCQEGYHIDGSKWTCQDTNECLTNNTCHANASCFNTAGSFYCKCNPGFVGDGLTNCSDIDECSLKIGNCTLKSVCINTIGGYFCACENGFQRNGTLCQDFDECSSVDLNNCHPRASCGNYIGGYNCSCMSGYTGNGYSCSDIDECKSDSLYCGVHASCYNTPGSYKCKCNPGWSGSGTNCTNIDECSRGSHTCIENSYCTDNQGSYTCTCMHGWTRQWFEPYGRCSKCDPNTLCSGHGKCLRNGTCDCLRHYRGANCSVCMSEVRCSGHGHCDFDGKCYCDPGWTRQPLDCSICSPEALCSGHGACNYDYETYKKKSCFCNDNFFGQNCSKACPIMEGEVCGLHGSCNRDPSSLLPCVCLSGYQWNSTSVLCEDTDECLLGFHECLPPAQCINTPGSYRCECPTLVGWSFDGKTCNDTDECQYPNVCDSQATCINFPGGFNCSCNTGWRGKGAHPICSDVDECAEGTDRCPGPSKCVNTLGSYYCICIPGWEKVSEFACKDIDECSLGIDGCDLNSACVNTAGSWQCTCNSGYYPDPSDARLPTCKDINECVQNANACPVVSQCVNYAGSYRCKCLSGWRNQGPHKCVDIDECSEGSHSCPVNSRCVNVQGSHQCHCNSGFTPPITTTTCQDLDECTTGSHSCSSFGNAYCVNTIGSYTCRCHNCYYMSGSSCKPDCRLETQNYYTTVYISYKSYYSTRCTLVFRCRKSRTKYRTRAALQSRDVWVANRAGAVCPCR